MDTAQERREAAKPDPSLLSGKHMFDPEASNRTAFVVGILVGLLTLFILYLWTRKKGGRTAVLIAGPCDVGKTVLFSRLVNNFSGKAIDTFTSMQENLGHYILAGGKQVTVVDMPGHERIRFAALDKHKASALGVVYVVDASTIKHQIRDAAEFLFKILSDPVMHSNRTPVLVACNKQDLSLTAKGSSVIEREMTKEIGLLRETHARLLDGTNADTAGNAADHVFLGKEGKDFEFSDLKAKIKFCETSGLTDMSEEVSGMEVLQSWIASLN